MQVELSQEELDLIIDALYEIEAQNMTALDDTRESGTGTDHKEIRSELKDIDHLLSRLCQVMP